MVICTKSITKWYKQAMVIQYTETKHACAIMLWTQEVCATFTHYHPTTGLLTWTSLWEAHRTYTDSSTYLPSRSGKKKKKKSRNHYTTTSGFHNMFSQKSAFIQGSKLWALKIYHQIKWTQQNYHDMPHPFKVALQAATVLLITKI